jgi:hypothetical protein
MPVKDVSMYHRNLHLQRSSKLLGLKKMKVYLLLSSDGSNCKVPTAVFHLISSLQCYFTSNFLLLLFNTRNTS